MNNKSNKVCFDGRIIDLLLNDDEFHRLVSTNQKVSTGRFPRTDQWCDEEGNFNLVFALAGYSPEDITVSVDGRFLRITSSKMNSGSENNKLEKGIIYRGIARRSFNKSYFIDSNYDLSSIKAKMKDGLLELNIPKNKETEIKEISIRSE